MSGPLLPCPLTPRNDAPLSPSSHRKCLQPAAFPVHLTCCNLPSLTNTVQGPALHKCSGPGGSICACCQPEVYPDTPGLSSLLGPVDGEAAPAPAPGLFSPSRVYLDAQGVCTIGPPGYNEGRCAPTCYQGQYRDPASGECRSCPCLCSQCRIERVRFAVPR